MSRAHTVPNRVNPWGRLPNRLTRKGPPGASVQRASPSSEEALVGRELAARDLLPESSQIVDERVVRSRTSRVDRAHETGLFLADGSACRVAQELEDPAVERDVGLEEVRGAFHDVVGVERELGLERRLLLLQIRDGLGDDVAFGLVDDRGLSRIA